MNKFLAIVLFYGFPLIAFDFAGNFSNKFGTELTLAASNYLSCNETQAANDSRNLESLRYYYDCMRLGKNCPEPKEAFYHRYSGLSVTAYAIRATGNYFSARENREWLAAASKQSVDFIEFLITRTGVEAKDALFSQALKAHFVEVIPLLLRARLISQEQRPKIFFHVIKRFVEEKEKMKKDKESEYSIKLTMALLEKRYAPVIRELIAANVWRDEKHCFFDRDVKRYYFHTPFMFAVFNQCETIAQEFARAGDVMLPETLLIDKATYEEIVAHVGRNRRFSVALVKEFLGKELFAKKKKFFELGDEPTNFFSLVPCDVRRLLLEYCSFKQ